MGSVRGSSYQQVTVRRCGLLVRVLQSGTNLIVKSTQPKCRNFDLVELARQTASSVVVLTVLKAEHRHVDAFVESHDALKIVSDHVFHAIALFLLL